MLIASIAPGSYVRFPRETTDLLTVSERTQDYKSIIPERDENRVTSHDVVPLLEEIWEAFRAEHPKAQLRLDLPETATVAAHGLGHCYCSALIVGGSS